MMFWLISTPTTDFLPESKGRENVSTSACTHHQDVCVWSEVVGNVCDVVFQVFHFAQVAVKRGQYGACGHVDMHRQLPRLPIGRYRVAEPPSFRRRGVNGIAKNLDS